MPEDLVIDKNGNIKSWKISYCGWLAPNTLLNEEKPFQVAYISAHTAEEAVSRLKENLRLSKIDVYGKPQLELISRDEYENGGS